MRRKRGSLPGSPDAHRPQPFEDPFRRIDTSTWEIVGTEPAGAEIKYVLADPYEAQKRWFFKNNTVDENLRYGEDFAEKIASHLAPLLGLASATVYLATHEGVEGIISLNVAPRGLELVHGAAWLPSQGITEFVRGDRSRRGHSLANIKRSLEGVKPPPGTIYPDGMTAFDAFAGMCIFDAWIANQDRHEENWAVLHPIVRREDLHEQLSPIYDNGSSLAFNLGEARMQTLINGPSPNIQTWSARAKAERLERVGPQNRRLGLVESACTAFELCTDVGKKFWQAKLLGIDLDRVRRLAHYIPEMSDTRSTFIEQLLTLNMERIQDVCISAS